jgi:hypothetical protein
VAGLPIDDHDAPAGLNGDEIVAGQKAGVPDGRGERNLWVAIRGEVCRAALQIVVPPTTELGTGDRPGELLGRDACEVLMDQAVKGSPLLKVALVLECWFHLDGGPAQAAHVAQLEAPGAVDVVLEAALAEPKSTRQGHLSPRTGLQSNSRRCHLVTGWIRVAQDADLLTRG